MPILFILASIIIVVGWLLGLGPGLSQKIEQDILSRTQMALYDHGIPQTVVPAVDGRSVTLNGTTGCIEQRFVARLVAARVFGASSVTDNMVSGNDAACSAMWETYMRGMQSTKVRY